MRWLLRDEEDGFRFFLDGLFRGEYSPAIVERLTADGTMPRIGEADLATATEPMDYLGVNVYSRVVVDAEDYNPRWWEASSPHTGGNFLANGMEYYPEALYEALQMLTRDYGVDIPFFVTENGVSASEERLDGGRVQDLERISYIRGFLEQAARAIADGYDLRGYFVWSLLDNYEWSAGFSQRFGIVHVDPHTLERTPKDSALWYRDVVARKGF